MGTRPLTTRARGIVAIVLGEVIPAPITAGAITRLPRAATAIMVAITISLVISPGAMGPATVKKQVIYGPLLGDRHLLRDKTPTVDQESLKVIATVPGPRYCPIRRTGRGQAPTFTHIHCTDQVITIKSLRRMMSIGGTILLKVVEQFQKMSIRIKGIEFALKRIMTIAE